MASSTGHRQHWSILHPAVASYYCAPQKLEGVRGCSMVYFCECRFVCPVSVVIRMCGLLCVTMMYMCVVRVSVGIYTRRPKQDVGCLPLSLLLNTLGQSLSWNQKLTIYTELAGQGTLRICLCLLPSAGAPGKHSNAWLFTCIAYWELECWCLQSKFSFLLSCLPAPTCGLLLLISFTSCLGGLGYMAVSRASS